MSTGASKRIFVAGATGYIGRALILVLLEKGHDVFGLARKESLDRLPKGCRPVSGDALNSSTYEDDIYDLDAFVHLVGVSHPSPTKAQQFKDVDLKSLQEAVQAAARQRVRHFVYISVAHPAPMMHSYIDVRIQCEALIRASGLNATILRPWYVLGPGHRWPILLAPFYWVAQILPPTRAGARRLGLVTLEEIVRTLLMAIEHPADGLRLIEVPAIRKARLPEKQKVAAASAGS